MNEVGLPFDNESGFSARDLRGMDRWESFSVSATITLVGSLTSEGRYRIVGRCCQYQISLIGSTSIATTAGTSYINLPITPAVGISGVAVMTNNTTNIAVGLCHVDVATGRCYLPSQVASGDLFNIVGWYEI
jgi:hypothetical protein